MNPYEELNISKSASADEIKKAYKRKAVEYHPDKTAGDKEKEEKFKKINEAYSILSDPKKKEMYDRFGTVDNTAGNMPEDVQDIFSKMFSGAMGGGIPGMGGMPGGFSFMFSGSDGGAGASLEDIFGQMFGGGHGCSVHTEKIDVPITLSEIYHGTTKKVEFELMDVCVKCNGCGASDPNSIIKCLTCKGEGKVAKQLNPFMITMAMCDSCGGTGSVIKNNKVCQGCKGGKTQYNKKSFELNIPKGIPHNYDIKMQGKGSWSPKTKQYGNIVFRFKYDIRPPYSLQGLDVHYGMTLTLDELLCGFEKTVDLYGETQKIYSEGYFNPTKPFVIHNKGIPDAKNPKNKGNFVIHFTMQYEDSNKISKYTDVLLKIYKRKTVELTEEEKKKALLVS